MSFAGVASIATAVIGAGSAIYSARQSRRIGEQAAEMADPFAESRPLFAQKLLDNWDRLTSTNPNDILRDPEFQFLKEQGLGGINAGMAAVGKFNSGNRALEGGKYATGLASQFLDKKFQQRQQILAMLGQLSGGTTGSPAAAGQLYGYGASAGLNVLNSGVGSTLALLNRTPWATLLGQGGGGGGVNAAAGTSGSVLTPPPGWGG